MKKNVIHLTLGRPKTRAHRVLFGDTPFKSKKVESKILYNRKIKHRKKMFNFD